MVQSENYLSYMSNSVLSQPLGQSVNEVTFSFFTDVTRCLENCDALCPIPDNLVQGLYSYGGFYSTERE